MSVDSTKKPKQYSEGEVSADISGNAIAWEVDEGTNALETVNFTNALPIQGPELHNNGTLVGRALRIAGMTQDQTQQLDCTVTNDANHMCLDVNVARVDGAGFEVSTELPTPSVPVDNSAIVSSPQVTAVLMGYDGLNLDLLRGTAADGLQVDLGPNNDIRITDGTDVADVLDLASSNPLAVAIVDGAGAQITSFGGGTQYTEADVDASITGTAILWEDGADTLRTVALGTPLPVQIGDGVDQLGINVDGSINTTSPCRFILDSNDQLVVLDTGVPASNVPLPVDLYDTNGKRATLANPLRVDPTGTTTQPVSIAAAVIVTSKQSLTTSSPTFATVGVASGVAVAANINRKGLVLTNTSTSVISFGLNAAAAVLNSGITLLPYGVWTMDEFNFSTVAVNAIASAAASNLSIQEFT